MDIRRAPKLRIEFARDGGSMTMLDTNDKEYTFPCRLDDRCADEYRKILVKTLDQVKEQLRKRDLTIEDASLAFDVLNQKGLSLLKQIFGDKCEQVVGVFEDCFRDWRTDTEPAVITVAAELSRFIPIELLPLFELSLWPGCDDLPTLEEGARRFPGFSAIIRREFPNIRVSQDLVLQNEPKLPLKCFVHRGLHGVEAEMGFFKNNQDHIDVDGPWPVDKMPRREFSKALADYLQYADQSFDGQARSPIDQIQHFICHCEIDETVSSDSLLRFSDGNDVTIADLQAFLAIPSGKNRPQSGPLIFLNACGTSRINPMAVTSFPRFFVEENRNRGFIGTETNVPDSFAAEFSQCFYRGLLTGLSLGRAIYDAKWAMLRERKNPLGILYTVYADPDLHVSKGVGVVN